jgi:hypothetical protein
MMPRKFELSARRHADVSVSKSNRLNRALVGLAAWIWIGP